MYSSSEKSDVILRENLKRSTHGYGKVVLALGG